MSGRDSTDSSSDNGAMVSSLVVWVKYSKVFRRACADALWAGSVLCKKKRSGWSLGSIVRSWIFNGQRTDRFSSSGSLNRFPFCVVEGIYNVVLTKDVLGKGIFFLDKRKLRFEVARRLPSLGKRALWALSPLVLTWRGGGGFSSWQYDLMLHDQSYFFGRTWSNTGGASCESARMGFQDKLYMWPTLGDVGGRTLLGQWISITIQFRKVKIQENTCLGK